MFQNKIKMIPVLAMTGLVLAGGLSACTPLGLAAGAGAAVGVAAVDERGVAGTAKDTRIRAEINSAWVQDDALAYTGVGLLIHEGRVVLTGTVESEAIHQKAVQLVRPIEGVRTIYDHIRVNPDSGVSDYAHDSKIVAAMRKAIFFDEEVFSLNYNIDASGSTLYLQGIAQSAAEKQRVLAHARGISGVRDIVEYIRIKDPEPIKQDAPVVTSDAPSS